MRRVAALFLGLAATAATSALAQQPPAYPAKPLKLIIPFPAGGPTDILGRLLAQRLGETWGQNIVTDDRTSGPSRESGARSSAKRISGSIDRDG